METMIDCTGCRNRGPACQDCVLSVLLEQHHHGGPAPVELDADERAAVAALAGQGLLPPLRLMPQSSPVLLEVGARPQHWEALAS